MLEFRISKTVASELKNVLEIHWQDGHSSRFHSCWLRYNCRCPACCKTVVGQHSVNRVEFSDFLTVGAVEVNKNGDQLSVVIGGETNEDHMTLMDCDWLRRMCYCDQCLQETIKERDLTFHPPSTVPKVDYEEIDDEMTQLRIMQHIFEVGFVILTNTPCEEGEVLKVAKKLGVLIETTYGKVSNVYDSDAKSENAANSTIGLPLHCDQCHYEAGPGIQILHAIQFDECVEGGDSQLVDMFQVMEIFRTEFPEDFRVLTRVPCAFSTIDYTRKFPAYIKIRKPIIEVDYDNQIVGFSWNPGIEDTLRVHENDVEPFYRAYKKLQNMMERKDLLFQFRLQSGDALLVNNRRMLHARASYKSNGGHRRLQVCYINSEELRSKYVVLGKKLGEEVAIRKIGNRSCI